MRLSHFGVLVALTAAILVPPSLAAAGAAASLHAAECEDCGADGAGASASQVAEAVAPLAGCATLRRLVAPAAATADGAGSLLDHLILRGTPR